MTEAFRSLDQAVRFARNLGPQVPFLKTIRDGRVLHDLVHEPLPQAVERVAAPQGIDVGLALAGSEQRCIPDAPRRDFQDLVDQSPHLALRIPFDDQAPAGALLRLVEQEMDAVLFQVGAAKAQDVASAKPGHELETDVGIGHDRAPVA